MKGRSFIRRHIRKKKEKTEEDEMILDYYYRLATISEILVSNSKWHLTDEEAIQEIRRILDVNSL